MYFMLVGLMLGTISCPTYAMDRSAEPKKKGGSLIGTMQSLRNSLAKKIERKGTQKSTPLSTLPESKEKKTSVIPIQVNGKEEQTEPDEKPLVISPIQEAAGQSPLTGRHAPYANVELNATPDMPTECKWTDIIYEDIQSFANNRTSQKTIASFGHLKGISVDHQLIATALTQYTRDSGHQDTTVLLLAAFFHKRKIVREFKKYLKCNRDNIGQSKEDLKTAYLLAQFTKDKLTAQRSIDNRTIAYEYILKGNSEMIKPLLILGLLPPDHKDTRGQTIFNLPHTSAAWVEYLRMMLTTYNEKAALEILTDNAGKTPFHHMMSSTAPLEEKAAIIRIFSTIQVLSEAGNQPLLSPNIQDHEGNTALHVLVQELPNQSAALMQFLITDIGMSPDIKNHKSNTPLMLVAQRLDTSDSESAGSLDQLTQLHNYLVKGLLLS